MNWLVVPTAILALILYFCAPAKRLRKARIFLACLSIPLAIPGLLMALYYLHLFDQAVWYYQFRAAPLSELTASGLGLGMGLIGSLRAGKLWLMTCFMVLLGILAIPYLKPIIRPIPDSAFHERWLDGICLQSTPASCGPACAATILRCFGLNSSERELARSSFTCLGGTENWYLARALRSRDISVSFATRASIQTIQLPAIAGVRIGRYGHFIAVLSRSRGTYTIADPLYGRAVFTSTRLVQRYPFTGFFMPLHPDSSPPS